MKNPTQPLIFPREPLVLSARFTRAVDYARLLHTEARKGTEIPYMAHLLGVTALVMAEAGGPVPLTEDMVIAAILHDTVKDHGGKPRLDDVEKIFGPHVARMVEGLSDTLAEDHDKKEGWDERKRAYLVRLRTEPEDVLVISAADKLYNAKSILDDLKQIGPAVWERFKRGPKEQLWYFHSLLEVFRARLKSPIVDELEHVVNEISYLVATEWPGANAVPNTPGPR
ncbi:MAG TPA: HD domain-containing protein [Terracidiphilus sp.]|jgi:(p)ppGpp synthase/HD superfamily hydrolase